MPSPRLPATVVPLAIRPMSFPCTVMCEAASVTPAPPALTSDSDRTIDPSEPVAKSKSPRPPWKSTVTTGDPANAGAEVPSIVDPVPVIAGQRPPPHPDRAGDAEVDRVGPRLRIGGDDRLTERPRPDIAQVRHRERRQKLTILQYFQNPRL